MNKKRYINRSKKFAIAIFVVTTLLTAFSIFKGFESAASAIFSTGITTSSGLYAVKIHNLRKEKEKNDEKNI